MTVLYGFRFGEGTAVKRRNTVVIPLSAHEVQSTLQEVQGFGVLFSNMLVFSKGLILGQDGSMTVHIFWFENRAAFTKNTNLNVGNRQALGQGI